MDPIDIGRELSGRGPRNFETQKKTRRQRPARTWSPEPERKTLPTASERASVVAQDWVDRAEAYGFRLPYNVNWLAHQVADRAVHDPRTRRMLQAGRHDDVQRLLLKMSALFWSDYVSNEDKPANVANVFFDVVWDDLRDYAYDSLRAAYLLEHGRRVAPSEIESDHHDDPAEKALREQRLRSWLASNESTREISENHRRLDERRRRVLGSETERSN